MKKAEKVIEIGFRFQSLQVEAKNGQGQKIGLDLWLPTDGLMEEEEEKGRKTGKVPADDHRQTPLTDSCFWVSCLPPFMITTMVVVVVVVMEAVKKGMRSENTSRAHE